MKVHLTGASGFVGSNPRRVFAERHRAGIPVVLTSTGRVFDGRQSPAAEDAPPNPVNAYGFLKRAAA